MDHLSTPLAPQLWHVTLMGRFLGMVRVVWHFWQRMVIVAPAAAAGAAGAAGAGAAAGGGAVGGTSGVGGGTWGATGGGAT